jgi:hypothetical protein
MGIGNGSRYFDYSYLKEKEEIADKFQEYTQLQRTFTIWHSHREDWYERYVNENVFPVLYYCNNLLKASYELWRQHCIQRQKQRKRQMAMFEEKKKEIVSRGLESLLEIYDNASNAKQLSYVMPTPNAPTVPAEDVMIPEFMKLVLPQHHTNTMKASVMIPKGYGISCIGFDAFTADLEASLKSLHKSALDMKHWNEVSKLSQNLIPKDLILERKQEIESEEWRIMNEIEQLRTKINYFEYN